MSVLKWVLFVSGILAFGNALPQNSGDVAPAERGKMIYEQHCLACHQADGSGVPNLAPPLIEGEFVSGEKVQLINIILKGMEGVEIKGEYYANPMPAFDYLTDTEIADVLTYIRSNFKNNADPVSETEVNEIRNP